jgi:hypothetical protein
MVDDRVENRVGQIRAPPHRCSPLFADSFANRFQTIARSGKVTTKLRPRNRLTCSDSRCPEREHVGHDESVAERVDLSPLLRRRLPASGQLKDGGDLLRVQASPNPSMSTQQTCQCPR